MIMQKKKPAKPAKTISSFRDSGFYFDDCAVCRFTAVSEEEGREPTLEELKEVFKKAGGTVVDDKF
jgi:hypothetical protein